MKTKEIREHETDHLRHELEERRKHLFDLRSQAVTEKLEDPTQLIKTRRDIARIMTVLNERKRQADRQAADKQATEKQAAGQPQA